MLFSPGLDTRYFLYSTQSDMDQNKDAVPALINIAKTSIRAENRQLSLDILTIYLKGDLKYVLH